MTPARRSAPRSWWPSPSSSPPAADRLPVRCPLPSPTASGSSSPDPLRPSRPSASPTRDEAWQIAIDTLLSERERIHPNPYHGIDKAAYRAAADDLAAQIPKLNDDQALAGITRLAAMPGWNGPRRPLGHLPVPARKTGPTPTRSASGGSATDS